MKKNLGRPYYIILVLLGVAFTLGFFLGGERAQISQIKSQPEIRLKNAKPPKNLEVDFQLFWDVWQRVTTSHLDAAKFDPKKLVEGAISGLVSATGDPYSAFLTAEENNQVKAELAGIYEGVGIQIGVKNGKIVVIAPLAGTPAEAGGVRAGDAILKIDDKQTLGLSLPEAVSFIRGKAGTNVKLTLQRGDGQPFEKELARAKIAVKSVEVKFENLSARSESEDSSESKTGKKIAILRLSRFGDNTNSEWDETVSKILQEKPAGIIFDLRNNPGGFLQGAIYVGSDFVGGRIVGQQDSAGKSEFFTAQHQPRLVNYPTVVLVNGGTASAAEIVSGALQEKKRVKLVGETTFGKGTIQDSQELTGGAGLHLTIAKWLLPSGKEINGSGLKPDIEIKAQDDKPDVQLEKAKEILRSLVK